MATGIEVSVTPQRASGLEAAILADVFQKLSASGITRRILDSVRAIIQDQIRQSPEFISMISGPLRQHLGLELPQPALENIVEAINKAILVQLKQAARSIQLTVSILRSDFSDALSAQGSSYITAKGTQINWLYWLLFEGANIIITTSHILHLKREEPTSRAGKAFMLTPNEGSEGWGVPAEFSGTPSDNWLTRAIAPKMEEIGQLMLNETRIILG